MQISEIDKKIIIALQEDLPVVPEPYKMIAEEIGTTEEVVLSRLQFFREKGIMRKLGAVLRHREVGFKANVLCVWIVPQDRLDEVAEIMCSNPAVTHCYDRNTTAEWPYNFYTMIHGADHDTCEAIAGELSEKTGIQERVMLYTVKEWKKTSMKYFCD